MNRIARWDGTAWEPLGAGLPDRAYATCVFDDGSGSGPELYVTAGMTSIGGVAVKNIAKWNGKRWAAVGEGLNGIALAMTVFDDGSGPALYAGGAFYNGGGPIADAGLMKWDGRQWTRIDGVINLADLYVLSLTTLETDAGPALVVAGHFQIDGLPTARGIALWRDGQWSSIGGITPPFPGTNTGVIEAVVAWPPDNPTSLIALGNFWVIGGVPASSIALWNGASWQAIPPPVVEPAHFEGQALATYQAGGCSTLFMYAGRNGLPVPREIVQSWNGSQWNSLDGGLRTIGLGAILLGQINQPYSALTTWEGRLFVGGQFLQAGGTPSLNIAAWNVEQGIDCAADTSNSGVIDVDDLIAVILQWGPCVGACTADSAPCGGDGTVNVDDLIAVILNWGPCPR